MSETKTNHPRVSAIIPTYERGDVLLQTVDMVLGQNYPDFELIVVDQSAMASDELVRRAALPGSRLRYIRLITPNLPGARNAGVRASSGEIVIFLDDDIAIDENYIAYLVRNFADESVGGAMGITLPSSGEKPDWSGQAEFLGMIERRADGTATVSRAVGCNMSFRKDALIKAGMSDERYTGSAWFEDFDLSVRVRSLGYKLILDSRFSLVHLEIPRGGCGNRTLNPELKDRERCRLVVYYCVKNRKILGRFASFRELWHAYRTYALNQHTLLNWPLLAKRHAIFAINVWNAARVTRAQGFGLTATS